MQDRPDRQRVAIPNRSSTPSTLDKRWFVHIDAKTYGPYSGHEIGKFAQGGRITGSDFVCPEGASAWIEARNEPTLGSLFRPRDAVPQPRATATAGAAARMHDQMRGLSSALEKQAGTAGGKPWWEDFATIHARCFSARIRNRFGKTCMTSSGGAPTNILPFTTGCAPPTKPTSTV